MPLWTYIVTQEILYYIKRICSIHYVLGGCGRSCQGQGELSRIMSGVFVFLNVVSEWRLSTMQVLKHLLLFTRLFTLLGNISQADVNSHVLVCLISEFPPKTETVSDNATPGQERLDPGPFYT